MQKFKDVAIDQNGNVRPSLSVTIKTRAGATATIYSDDGTTTTANPITTDSEGGFEFYAANGQYDAWVSGVNQGPIALFDPADGFTQSGTGATTRDIEDKMRESVSVKDFGALGDGSTNDSAAIQAAVDRVRALVSTVNGWTRSIELVFPPGVYVVSTQIDMTGIRSVGVTVTGYGATLHGKCSGKPVIDALYSRFITWNGLTIIGDATNVPKFGIQIGVKDSTNVAGEHSFNDVTIVGTFTKAAHYNHGAETTAYHHCRFYNNSAVAASYALIMDGNNAYSAASDFVTVTNVANTNHSFNENTFFACDIRKQVTGRTIAYSGAPARHKFIGCYGVSPDDWIVEFYRVSGVAQMELDLHCEASNSLGFLLVDNVNPSGTVFLQGMKMRDHNPQVTDAIIDTTGTTQQVIFDGCDLEFAAPVSGVPLVGATSASSAKVLLSGTIRWQSANTLNLSNCRFTGTIYTETSTTVTHTLGSYQIVRRPNSADGRAQEFKGETRFSGTKDGTDASNWLAIVGSAAGGTSSITAAGADANQSINITAAGTGTVNASALSIGGTAIAGSSGSSLVGFLQDGANTVARTLQAKTREIVSINDFDGADATAKLTAAITYLKTVNGGEILVPPATYTISSKVTVDGSNILIKALGGDITHDVGSQGANSAVIFNWTGAAGGTMLEFSSPTGASAQKKSGGGVRGVYFKANGAATGLSVLSWNGGQFSDLFFEEFSTTGISVNVVATLGEARDPQQNKFSNIGSRQLTTTGACLTLDGDATANVSMNVFEQIDAQYNNGDAYVLRNCDNNLFIRCRATRAGGGTGNSLVLHGSNSAAGEVARANSFIGWSAPVAAVAKGTTSYTHPSINNTFLLSDSDNATPSPTAETGATVYYSNQKGYHENLAIRRLGVGDNATTAQEARDAVTTESLYIRNGSSNHVRLTDGTNTWAFGIDNATGRLRVLRIAGSGAFYVANQTLVDSLSSVGTANLAIYTNSTEEQLRINHTASIANRWTITGGAAGQGPILSASGSDTNISGFFYNKGTGGWRFTNTSQANYFSVSANGTTAPANCVEVRAASTGNAAVVATSGSDTDRSLNIDSAGTGTISLRPNGTTIVTAASTGMTASPATAIPAGGSTSVGYKATSTANFGVFFGSGAPTLSAAKGSLYLRSDGSTTNDRGYINTDGGTTWTAITTAA